MIDWLNPRWRRQFPYERYNRWSQSPDEKRRWTKALEAEGVEAVRRALQQSRADPPGLIRIGDTSMTHLRQCLASPERLGIVSKQLGSPYISGCPLDQEQKPRRPGGQT